MKIAVDVCIGDRGARRLQQAGHVLIRAQHGEPDEQWLERAALQGARLYLSSDADVEIFAYDLRMPFIKQYQRESGDSFAFRVLRILRERSLTSA